MFHIHALEADICLEGGETFSLWTLFKHKGLEIWIIKKFDEYIFHRQASLQSFFYTLVIKNTLFFKMYLFM